jgi:hypothetical protein
MTADNREKRYECMLQKCQPKSERRAKKKWKFRM